MSSLISTEIYTDDQDSTIGGIKVLIPEKKQVKQSLSTNLLTPIASAFRWLVRKSPALYDSSVFRVMVMTRSPLFDSPLLTWPFCRQQATSISRVHPFSADKYAISTQLSITQSANGLSKYTNLHLPPVSIHMFLQQFFISEPSSISINPSTNLYPNSGCTNS